MRYEVKIFYDIQVDAITPQIFILNKKNPRLIDVFKFGRYRGHEYLVGAESEVSCDLRTYSPKGKNFFIVYARRPQVFNSRLEETSWVVGYHYQAFEP